MFNTLMVMSGLFWTATYLLIIRQGFRDRTYGMPLAALAANLSWEFVFSAVHPHGFPQIAVNWVWLLFDLVIAWQVLKYGPGQWGVSRWAFAVCFILSIFLAFPAVLLVTYEFVEYDKMSGAYAAFGQNLMMSVLFINFFRERGKAGQHGTIAACKFIGTLFASLGFFLYTSLGNSPLMVFLFLSIAVVDVIYLGILLRADVEPAPVAICTALTAAATESSS
ncbi:MAG: hypothetical protein KDA88_18205 [Planctomycetaceae bacterium]|nr:hypothetical protein [Planctomycetaceae bacterium]MCB9949461.1 hypothetical protein [Planctomycetaceae bacterium]